MVRLQRRFNWSLLVVVLCSTVPCFCTTDNSTALNPTHSVDQPNAFPQDDTNNRIMTCENFLDALKKTNSSNPNVPKILCNTTFNNLNASSDTGKDNSSTTLKYNEENNITAKVENTSPSTIANENSITSTIKKDAEVDDLNNETIYVNPNHLRPASVSSTNDSSQGRKMDAELIDDGQNTEDGYRNSSALESDASAPGVPLMQGQLAAILAGVFVAISIIAYVGLLSWRRYLENRYGSRQMLVNEDEFNDDLRHFSI